MNDYLVLPEFLRMAIEDGELPHIFTRSQFIEYFRDFGVFSINYLNVFLSNSEVDSQHSMNYIKMTQRLGDGVYCIV